MSLSSSSCLPLGSTAFLLAPDHYDSIRSTAGDLIGGGGCGSQHLSLSDKPHLSPPRHRLNSLTRRPNSEPPPASSLPRSDSCQKNEEKDSAFIVKQFAKFHLSSKHKSKRHRRRWRMLGSIVGSKKNQELIQKERTRLQLQQHRGGNVIKNDGLLRPSPLSKKVAELALRLGDSTKAAGEGSSGVDSGDDAANSGKIITATSLTCIRSAALNQNGLSQSLQDFSECCQELETFTIDERRRGGRKGSPRALQKSTSKSEEDASRVEKSECVSDKEGEEVEGSGSEYNDISVDDLAGYLTEMVFPKKMSYMAEMMYT